MKHVVLYVGHLYKPFWTKKIWPGWQGGSGKVKIMHLCTFPIEMTQMCHILTFPGPSCRPGQIFLVQNGLYRCPTYSTTCFMLNSHPGGYFCPLKSDLGVFWPFRGPDFIMGKNKNANFSKRAHGPIFKFCVMIREVILQKMPPILDTVIFFRFWPF